jgi:hypothetical protein
VADASTVFPGFGTVVNASTVLVGSGAGVLLGGWLSARTRSVVTDGLGLVTLLIAGLSASAVTDPQLAAAVGDDAPLLIVLGAVLIGGILGSLLRIEDRLEGVGQVLRRRLAPGTDSASADSASTDLASTDLASTDLASAASRERFLEGFVTASLVFCVGPLTVLGSLSEGLGQGSEQLLLKATLDGFASMAFAASLVWGVAASAVSVVAVQGSLTALGAALGSFVPDAHIAAMTVTGGLLLVGVSLRLLQLKPLPVGDLLPALVVAPLLVQLVVAVG